MPLFYYARQSQIATKEGVKTWHLSLKKVGKVVDTQLLAESIAEKSSLTPGDVQNVIRNLMSTMRMHLLNSRTVRLNGLGTFTMKARTRGKGTVKAEDVNPNQVTALRCQFTPEYTRDAGGNITRALMQASRLHGSRYSTRTRALLQGVEFEKWLEAAVDGGTSGGGESDGGEEEDPLG